MGYKVLLLVDNGIISIVDFNEDEMVLQNKKDEMDKFIGKGTKVYIENTDLDKAGIKRLRTNVIELRID